MRLHSDASHDEDVIGIGYVIRDDVDDIEIIGSQFIRGEFTSMEAEYTAMMSGIHAASWQDNDALIVQTDCDPLVEKMKFPREGDTEWFGYWEDFNNIINTFDSWSITTIPREFNSEADRLAKEALWSGRENC